MSDDIRPFFGEHAEVLEGPEFAPPDPVDGAAFMDEHLDARIRAFVADGVCPMCKHDLDGDGVCCVCAFNAAAPRRSSWGPEEADGYVATLPGALQLQFVDEFAPAAVDWDAA